MKKIFWAVILLILIALAMMFLPSKAHADGIFQPCEYLNNCETFATTFTVKNFKNGILVEGEVPDADLDGSPDHPLEVIVTTGDVYTRCANEGQPYEVTGNVLYMGEVVSGHFSAYFPLAEGHYNITVYMGQSHCANCPQAWVQSIDVKHKRCDWTVYILKGNYPCYLNRNRELGDSKTDLPVRFDGTDYMQSLCQLKNCDGEVIADFKWNGEWITSCTVPVCTACQ